MISPQLTSGVGQLAEPLLCPPMHSFRQLFKSGLARSPLRLLPRMRVLKDTTSGLATYHGTVYGYIKVLLKVRLRPKDIQRLLKTHKEVHKEDHEADPCTLGSGLQPIVKQIFQPQPQMKSLSIRGPTLVGSHSFTLHSLLAGFGAC